MTGKEAITRFDGWIDSILDKANTDNRKLKENEMLDVEMAELVIDAMKKQIPQKVVNQSCPVCVAYFSDEDAELNVPYVNYCYSCGQALDWSE